MNKLTIDFSSKTFSYICNDCDRYVKKPYYDIFNGDDCIKIFLDKDRREILELSKYRLDIIKFIS